VLVPPAKNQRTLRWGRFAQRFGNSPSKYHADRRGLLWLGLVLAPLVAIICGVWLALPAQPTRKDVKPINRIVSPALDRNDDGYVEKLRPILGWKEP
jgi:hypothetical protein